MIKPLNAAKANTPEIVTVHVWMAPQKHLPAADDADDADAALRLRGKQQ